jgi:hypothetical protein
MIRSVITMLIKLGLACHSLKSKFLVGEYFLPETFIGQSTDYGAHIPERDGA